MEEDESNMDWDYDAAPKGRGPGGSKRGGKFKRHQNRRGRGNQGRDTCRPFMRRDEDEDGPGGPGPNCDPHQGRERCHSNVFIRQNVNVQ